MKMRLAVTISLYLSSASSAQVIVGFEDLPPPTNGFYNGSDSAGGFSSGGARFNNSYNTTFGSWSGWSYSRVNNTTTVGFGNQYAAYNLPTGSGDNSLTYAIAFSGGSTIQLPPNTKPTSLRLTNTTYTALSMANGDQFSKKFGGPSGNDPDFFKLTIQGFNALNVLVGSVDVFLADYRFATNSQDFILSQWTTTDLTPLGISTRLTFNLTSSDVGQFGMNTPAYFALDNFNVAPVPEPGTITLILVGLLGGFGCNQIVLRRGKANTTAK